MNTIDRQADLIAKLVRLSVEGRIVWSPDESGGYRTRAFGRDVRIFQEDRTIVSYGDVRLGMPRFRERTGKIYVLEILPIGAKQGYRLEDVTGLDDVFRAASYRASGIDEFVAEVLAS